MPVSKKLLNHLQTLKIRYKPVVHKTVYTAYDVAATLKAKLQEIPKVIHVVADKKRHILVIVPAAYQVDFSKLKKALAAKKVELASEKVMQTVFKVKSGAVTAFGGLYKNVEVLVDRAFARTKRVFVSAGNYTDSLELKTKDFFKATGGKLGVYGKKRG